MLEINNLSVQIEENQILKDLSLKIGKGEVHAIMGPNGSGKSTLAKVIAGHPSYEVQNGDLNYEFELKKVDLHELEPYERSQKGIFLGFQYPVEIPGVNNLDFLLESFNETCIAQGIKEMEKEEFLEFLKPKLKKLNMSEDFLYRSVNEGFSGGEKKKNEILQLQVLNPKLAILDETDSGLDVDALKIVSEGVNDFKSKYNSTILITHYQRLLDHIKPDFVHIMYEGKIIKTGGPELALVIENEGYDGIIG